MNNLPSWGNSRGNPSQSIVHPVAIHTAQVLPSFSNTLLFDPICKITELSDLKKETNKNTLNFLVGMSHPHGSFSVL